MTSNPPKSYEVKKKFKSAKLNKSYLKLSEFGFGVVHKRVEGIPSILPMSYEGC